MHLVIDDQVARHQLLCRAVGRGRGVATIDRGMAGPNCQHHRKIGVFRDGMPTSAVRMNQPDAAASNPLSCLMTGGATHLLRHLLEAPLGFVGIGGASGWSGTASSSNTESAAGRERRIVLPRRRQPRSRIGGSSRLLPRCRRITTPAASAAIGP